MWSGAGAQATGGAGPQAGVALATATSFSPWLYNSASATANYSGPLVRSATANGATFTYEGGPVDSHVFAQASAGDVRALNAPTPAGNANVVVHTAAAPDAATTATLLAANERVAAALNGGPVWALASVETEAGNFDRTEASFAYTFDPTVDSGHLWLGLLEGGVGGTLTVTGGDKTLFEQTFLTPDDYLANFDRPFDLGDLSGLIGSDGLLNIAVAFSGAFDTQFLFGQSLASADVPEPAAPSLLLAGLTGMWLARRRLAGGTHQRSGSTR
ncbi:conserved hypothetical protein [Ricinus communis]|uniref:PEP-CTERM protein-sorting domain-containing protein n=1 Tax=Ricinus communis TaxID=3988 RepID=B9TPR8_RICCO|nr:conserved hypothetical protein [Ricinus communis]